MSSPDCLRSIKCICWDWSHIWIWKILEIQIRSLYLPAVLCGPLLVPPHCFTRCREDHRNDNEAYFCVAIQPVKQFWGSDFIPMKKSGTPLKYKNQLLLFFTENAIFSAIHKKKRLKYLI